MRGDGRLRVAEWAKVRNRRGAFGEVYAPNLVCREAAVRLGERSVCHRVSPLLVTGRSMHETCQSNERPVIGVETFSWSLKPRILRFDPIVDR